MVATIEIPSTHIHMSEKLITPGLRKIIDGKIMQFKKENMHTASFDEVVGRLTGYELITTTDNCGGYCNSNNRIIALRDVSDWDRYEIRGGKKLPITVKEWGKKTIMHEIAHAIQAEAEIFEKHPLLLTSMATIEWQAESIAYKLMNSCYYPLRHEYFSSYFKKEDLEFLRDWYDGYIQNDVSL